MSESSRASRRQSITDRPASYVFDRYRLSGDGTMLLRNGTPVALAPKVLRTLTVLVDRAGEVVTKEELLQSIWPDSFVEDTGLTRNISVLRLALGDDGRRFIVTIPRIGYRFVGAVERTDVPAGSVAAPSTNTLRTVSSERAMRGAAVVGRRAEIDALHAAFAMTRDGSGGVVAVSGEPGIGKSTVVEEFLSQLPGSVSVTRGRCSERLAGAEAHLPVLEAIDGLIAQDSRHAECLKRVAPTWHAHVAPRGDDGGGQPAGSADRLLRELTVFLEEISRTQPVVIALEDLHWSDVSTVDVIAHLAARLPRMAVLLVVTYRRHELIARRHPFGRLLGELRVRGTLTELPLGLLTREDVSAYVTAALGDRDLMCDLPALVYRKTEGNPLFMVDLVRYLQEPGRAETDIPASLRDMIDHTLRAIDPGDQRVLTVAAIHGYEFESAVVASVADADAADVDDRLQTLQHAHSLIDLDREHVLPDGTVSRRYRFVHVLYQDALCASVAPPRRAAWAQRIAQTLAAAYGTRTDPIAGTLAMLFEMGRDHWGASGYFLAAAQTAARRFGFAEAIDLARRGLRCLEAAAGAQTTARRTRQIDLTFALLVPLASIEGYGAPEIEALTERLLDLSEGQHDATRTSMALGATWLVRMVRGECAAAKAAAVEMISVAGAAGNDALLINAHMQAQVASHHMGEFHEAQRQADAAIALEGRVDPVERLLTIFDPVVASLAESSRNAWILGDLTRAVDHSERAVALARDIRHPDSLAFAWLFHAWLNGYRGDWNTCLRSSEAGMDVAADSGSVQTLAWNRGVHGWALAHTGKIREGVDALSSAIDASRAIMGQVAVPQFSAMMAESLLLDRQIAAAQRWIDQALELSNRQLDRYFDAELYRLGAACCLARGERDAAFNRLSVALEVAAQQGAAVFEERAAMMLQMT